MLDSDSMETSEEGENCIRKEQAMFLSLDIFTILN